ncbi:GM20663 [Drosophila sechellia]|uniref:GM20663 n=1 Tax=Drosophila sechellia TaxID=7238 RepID=B4HS91_DROSE|nr:GM20663 [Drosophila sechellia]
MMFLPVPTVDQFPLASVLFCSVTLWQLPISAPPSHRWAPPTHQSLVIIAEH